jgi:NAD(P)H-flavin reductase
MSWDSETGTTEILAFLRGNGPASHWIAGLSEGAICRYMGPPGSVSKRGCQTMEYRIGGISFGVFRLTKS